MGSMRREPSDCRLRVCRPFPVTVGMDANVTSTFHNHLDMAVVRAITILDQSIDVARAPC